MELTLLGDAALTLRILWGLCEWGLREVGVGFDARGEGVKIAKCVAEWSGRISGVVSKGNGIRIDQGNLNNSQEYQQVDHVVINSGGRIIGRDGNPISGDIKSNAYDAHMPLSDWLKWKNWNSPK